MSKGQIKIKKRLGRPDDDIAVTVVRAGHAATKNERRETPARKRVMK